MNMTSATSGSTQFAWKPDCRWKKTRPTPAASMASAGHHQNCGGPIAFMARRDEVPILEYELLEDIEESLRSNDMAASQFKTCTHCDAARARKGQHTVVSVSYTHLTLPTNREV